MVRPNKELSHILHHMEPPKDYVSRSFHPLHINITSFAAIQNLISLYFVKVNKLLLDVILGLNTFFRCRIPNKFSFISSFSVLQSMVFLLESSRTLSRLEFHSQRTNQWGSTRAFGRQSIGPQGEDWRKQIGQRLLLLLSTETTMWKDVFGLMENHLALRIPHGSLRHSTREA